MSTLAVNKRANYDYEILENYEAGIVLTGQEVKAIRAGQIRLKGSYVVFHGGNHLQAFLINAHVGHYKPAGALTDYNPTRSRRLLLKKKELHHLFGRTINEGLTVIPLKLYTKGSLLKLGIALGRGKKKYDKRQAIRKREWDKKRRTLTKQTY